MPAKLNHKGHGPERMREQKGFAPILIILLIVLAVGGYFIYKNQQKPAPVPQQTIQPSPTSSDETVYTEAIRSANWKTYTNSTYGYSIKFPDNYEVSPQTERQKSQLGVDNNMCVALKKNSTCYLVIDYWQKSFDDVVMMKLPTDGSQFQDYTVGNVKGKRIVYKIGESTTMVLTVLPKPGVTDKTMTLSYTVSPGNVETPKVIEQILSTFKFIQ